MSQLNIPLVQQQNQNPNQEHYRIAKEWRNLTVNFTEYIQQVVAFEKTSPQDTSYKIMIYFNQGRYQIWNIENQEKCDLLTQEERKICSNAKKLTAISHNEIAYIDPKEQKLKILNIETHAHQDFQAKFPTLRAMPEGERNEEKINNMINDGLQLVYLHKHKLFITLEEKGQYSTSNQIIISCWKKENYIPDDNGEVEFFWQTDFEEAEQKNLQIVNMNDDRGTIVIHGCSFFEQNFKYRKHSCVEQTTPDSFQNIEGEQLNAQIVAAFPKNQTQITFWGNLNNAGIPIAMTIDLTNNHTQKQELDIFEANQVEEETKNEDAMEEEDIEMDTSWMITDVLHYNAKKNIAVIGRSCLQGEFIDIYNPSTNKITFSCEVSEEMGVIKRSFSLDERYFIEYEQSHHCDNDDPDSEMYVSITINTIVGIRTSICYFLEESGVMDIYCPSSNQNKINDENNNQNINQQQKPDREYEQLLEEIIGALTTGIKI